MRKFWTMTAAAALLGTMATSASAATFLFDFKGADPAQDAKFTIDDDRVPTQAQQQSFSYNNVTVLRNVGSTVQTLNFYTAAGGGGFNFATAGFDAYGAQLFTGTTGNPSFLSGVFTMRRSNPTNGAILGTLTISQAVTAVPEPATWAFLLLGFAGVGGMLRKGAKRPARVRANTHGTRITA